MLMIELDLLTAISLYLCLTVVGILLVWISTDRKRVWKDFEPEENSVWHCNVCTYFYIDSSGTNISICPQCGSYNKR